MLDLFGKVNAWTEFVVTNVKTMDALPKSGKEKQPETEATASYF
ncbi:hypothetical protein SAMN05216343_11163 [Oscillibacter sp. PC13]|nr:hypothetical protein [Oscillibacter sp. PC13]SFP65409.1 hypothetical protein SAMN05216343_11163 [Oscillibacter sp. PC13]